MDLNANEAAIALASLSQAPLPGSGQRGLDQGGLEIEEDAMGGSEKE